MAFAKEGCAPPIGKPTEVKGLRGSRLTIITRYVYHMLILSICHDYMYDVNVAERYKSPDFLPLQLNTHETTFTEVIDALR